MKKNKFNDDVFSQGVISSFDDLAVAEKTKLVRLLIMCVTKGDIYSEDCGKLFAVLIQSENLKIADIIIGYVIFVCSVC